MGRLGASAPSSPLTLFTRYALAPEITPRAGVIAVVQNYSVLLEVKAQQYTLYRSATVCSSRV